MLEPLPRGELTRRAQEIAARHYEIPGSRRTSVSVDTLRDWALRYRTGGLEALAPKPRQDRGQSRAIPPQLADLIERLKRENPHRTGTTLLRELALVSGQNQPALSASTLYRFLKQRGLTPRQLPAPPAHKKFEAQHANQIWQSDVLYGPYVERPGGGKRQAFRHAILDDASRLVPHAQFYADQGLNHFLAAARAAAAEIIILDPLYSTHDPDENDTRAMAALCQSLLRLREASRAALIVVHHVRKSIGRYEIGSAFRGSSALHAVGDSYLRVTRPAPQFPTVEWRFQFRYAAPQPPRLLELDPHSLGFSPAGSPPPTATVRRKVEPADVTEVLSDLGGQARYNQLRQGVKYPIPPRSVNRQGALRNPKSNLQNQRGNIVRKSVGKIVARYRYGIPR